MDEITDESPQNIRTTEIRKRKIRKKLIKCVKELINAETQLQITKIVTVKLEL